MVTTVATWNVLHRVHAENWGEMPAQRFADEADRVGAITRRIVDLFDIDSCDFVALQEVSGDQMTALSAALRERFTFHMLRYPRTPHLRNPAAHVGRLDDHAEYLVAITRMPSQSIEAAAFSNDGGKGYLAVAFGDTTIINTHVSYGENSAGQLARLAALARTRIGTTIVLGDFNADADAVATGLGADFACFIHRATALPSRPSTAAGTAQTIDHVFVRGRSAGTVEVLDAGGLSDHNIVKAQIWPA